MLQFVYERRVVWWNLAQQCILLVMCLFPLLKKPDYGAQIGAPGLLLFSRVIRPSGRLSHSICIQLGQFTLFTLRPKVYGLPERSTHQQPTGSPNSSMLSSSLTKNSWAHSCQPINTRKKSSREGFSGFFFTLMPCLMMSNNIRRRNDRKCFVCCSYGEVPLLSTLCKIGKEMESN